MIKRKGFTLVETMVAVAIIGLLAGIAIPNFIKAKITAEKNSCVANLRQIRDAVQRWALENDKNGTDAVVMSDISPDYLKSWPNCRGIPHDVPTDVSTDPACPNGIADHHL